jgi:hypothetical protein
MDRDGDFDTSLMMFRMLGPVMGIYFVFAFLVIPLIIYLIARWRDGKQATPILSSPQDRAVVLRVVGFRRCLAAALLIRTIINSSGSVRSPTAIARVRLAHPGQARLRRSHVLLTKTNQVFSPASAGSCSASTWCSPGSSGSSR